MKLEEPVDEDDFIELSDEVDKINSDAELFIIGYPMKYNIVEAD